jgi:hypothetical protein
VDSIKSQKHATARHIFRHYVLNIRFMENLLLVQLTYYGITAVWPLVHIRSFMAVTGPKTDRWLVKTVAVVLLAITLSLLSGYYEGLNLFPTVVLALSSAAGLAAIDFWYGLRGVISRVYVIDGVLQVFFSIAWFVVIARS